jgi:hypothetical protein
LTGDDLMARGPATFRQRDLMGAVKAMRMAGFEIARVEVDKSGKIVVVPRQARAADRRCRDQRVG